MSFSSAVSNLWSRGKKKEKKINNLALFVFRCYLGHQAVPALTCVPGVG